MTQVARTPLAESAAIKLLNSQKSQFKTLPGQVEKLQGQGKAHEREWEKKQERLVRPSNSRTTQRAAVGELLVTESLSCRVGWEDATFLDWPRVAKVRTSPCASLTAGLSGPAGRQTKGSLALR